DLEAPPAFVRNEPERLREKEALIGKRTIDAATVLRTSDRDEVEVGLVSEERELETSTSVLGSVAGAAVASGARHACEDIVDEAGRTIGIEGADANRHLGLETLDASRDDRFAFADSDHRRAAFAVERADAR